MKQLFCLLFVFAFVGVCAQQLPDAGFEDWTGEPFKNQPQPRHWHASNVSQFGLKFNFAHRQPGHSGAACLMVQDQEVGAAGIKETSPGYFSLGYPWVYIENLFKVRWATAGTYGGVAWKYRPDSMVVWIKRTGAHTNDEDFHLLYYSWRGTAKSSHYKAKNESCTKVSYENEESDIRLQTNGNECGTDQKAVQVAEGWWRERRTYSNWTRIVVPIYYFDKGAPTMMNLIFSASNYPNFRANSGLYAGNSLYVDDIRFVYSAKIQKVVVDNVEWKDFNPESQEVQVYTLPVGQTTMPTSLSFYRGCGRLVNAKGKTTVFPGRRLETKELVVVPGVLNGRPTIVTVRSEDGKSTRIYKLKFVTAH